MIDQKASNTVGIMILMLNECLEPEELRNFITTEKWQKCVDYLVGEKKIKQQDQVYYGA